MDKKNKKKNIKDKDKGHAVRGYGERIKIAAKNTKGASELSRLIGVPRNTLQRYINEDTEPSISTIVNISKVTGVSIDWLTMGEEHNSFGLSEPNNPESDNFIQPSDFKKRNSINSKDETFASIPVLNISASAGDGAASVMERQVGIVKFDRSYLHNTWNLNPNDLFTISTIGESMEPTIKAGEYLLASKSEEYLNPADGIYVIRLEGDILVKRLQRLPGEKILISSDNPIYKSYEIKLDDGIDFKIVGKVVLVHGVRKV